MIKVGLIDKPAYMLTITRLVSRQPLELLCKVYLRQFSVVDVRGNRQLDLSCLNPRLIDGPRAAFY